MRLIGKLIAMVLVIIVMICFKVFFVKDRVTFNPIGMSIDVGKDWKKIRLQGDAGNCTPLLVGAPGMIAAKALDPEIAQLQDAVDKVDSETHSRGGVVADSVKREPFTTKSGLEAIHYSCLATNQSGSAVDVRNHSFITRDMKGHYIAINYVTKLSVESPQVITAIEESLRVE